MATTSGVYKVRMISGYEYVVVAVTDGRGGVEYGELPRAEYQKRRIKPSFSRLLTKEQFEAERRSSIKG